MARQPLSSRLPNTGFALGPGFLAERPKAAALIAECIATWSEIELQTGRLIANLLGVPFEPVTAFYLSLANRREKRKVLDPIAKFVFTESKHRELYEAVMRARSSSESERIEFAHSLFGIADDDPEGVIIITTTDRIKHMFEVNIFLKKMLEKTQIEHNNTRSSQELYENQQRIRDLIYHYSIFDIENILNDMNQLHKLIFNFSIFSDFVIHKQSVAIEELYNTLINEPFVRQFLYQSSSNQKN